MTTTLDANNLKLKLNRLQNDLQTWTTLKTCLHSRAQNLLERYGGKPQVPSQKGIHSSDDYLALADIAQEVITDLQWKIAITKDQLILAHVIPPPSP